MAGETQVPVRVAHVRDAAFAIVAHHLEFETTRLLVVADDLDQLRRILVTQVQAIPEEQPVRCRALTVEGNHHPRVVEIVWTRHGAL